MKFTLSRLIKASAISAGLLWLSGCSSVLSSSQPTTAQQATQAIEDLGLSQEYPFNHHFLQTTHGRMHYIDEGKGQPVLMVHGNPSWSFLYRNFVKGLSDQNRIIAPDLIGFGLSQKPNDVDSYSIQGHVDDVDKLITSLDLNNLTLVFQDWGGPIALAVAARHPQRIKALVVLNTFGAFPPLPSMDENNIDLPFELDMFRAPLIGNLLVKQLGMFENMAMKMATVDHDHLNTVKIAYTDVFTDADDRAGVMAFPQLIPDRLAHPSAQLIKHQVEPFVNNFKGPVKIFWGMQDPFFPPEMLTQWQHNLPQATTLQIDDASHYLQEDAHDKIVPVLKQFLKDINVKQITSNP